MSNNTSLNMSLSVLQKHGLRQLVNQLKRDHPSGLLEKLTVDEGGTVSATVMVSDDEYKGLTLQDGEITGFEVFVIRGDEGGGFFDQHRPAAETLQAFLDDLEQGLERNSLVITALRSGQLHLNVEAHMASA